MSYDKKCHHAKTCGLDFCLGIETCPDAMRRERQILFSAPMVRAIPDLRRPEGDPPAIRMLEGASG